MLFPALLFHFVKPRLHTFVLFSFIARLSIIASFLESVYALGQGLPACATNSSRKGSNLWGLGQSFASTWWRTHCRTRHGRHAFRARYSLASRRRRKRKDPHSRTLCHAAEKTPRKRRREINRISRRSQIARLETAGQNSCGSKADSVKNPQISGTHSCQVLNPSN